MWGRTECCVAAKLALTRFAPRRNSGPPSGRGTARRSRRAGQEQLRQANARSPETAWGRSRARFSGLILAGQLGLRVPGGGRSCFGSCCGGRRRIFPRPLARHMALALSVVLRAGQRGRGAERLSAVQPTDTQAGLSRASPSGAPQSAGQRINAAAATRPGGLEQWPRKARRSTRSGSSS